jgi:hypothetical protein
VCKSRKQPTLINTEEPHCQPGRPSFSLLVYGCIVTISMQRLRPSLGVTELARRKCRVRATA